MKPFKLRSYYLECRIRFPHFGFQLNQIVRVDLHNLRPRAGQFVLIDGPEGPEIAIYRKHYLELSTGLEVLGLMDRIVGVLK